MVIHKQDLNLFRHNDECRLHLPLGAKILSVAYQEGQPVVWYRFHAEDVSHVKTQERTFRSYYTGYEMHVNQCLGFTHLATLQRPDSIVLHIFEEI